MKSDVFHAYDPTSVRESVLGVRMSRSPLTINDSQPIQQPAIGYKLPFSSDLTRFSERLERQNDDVLRIATPCRICPQYGHALIFPRKCYYEAQCPLPLLFCAKTRAGKADDGKRYWVSSMPRTPPKRPVECPNPKGLIKSSVPDSHQHAEIASIESRGSQTCNHAVSSPGYPAPKSTHHGERPVRTSSRSVAASTHPEFPTLVRSFLRRLSSTLSKKIAYNDPTRENTNFGWRKKA